MNSSLSSEAIVQPSEEARKQWLVYVAELDKRQLSGSENFDKSVLTLSSAGLALSINFLKDFVPLNAAAWPWALYLSWSCFVTATAATMISFLCSGRAMEIQKSLAHKGFILGEDSAFEERTLWATSTLWLNRLSATCFVAALVSTSLFFGRNLNKPETRITMANSPSPSQQQRGAPVPGMQRPASPCQHPLHLRNKFSWPRTVVWQSTGY